MPIIDCLQKAKLDKDIENLFSPIKEDMPESKQRELAIDLANKYYIQLREEAAKLSRLVGHIPNNPKPKKIDIPSETKRIEEEYGLKISSIENEILQISSSRNQENDKSKTKKGSNIDLFDLMNKPKPESESNLKNTSNEQQQAEPEVHDREIRSTKDKTNTGKTSSKTPKKTEPRPETASEKIRIAGNKNLVGDLEGEVKQLMMGVKYGREVLQEIYGSGGKANNEYSRKLRGGRFIGKSIAGEIKNKDAFMNQGKNGKFNSIDSIVHFVMENISNVKDRNIDEQEVKDIIVDTIADFNSPSQLAENIIENHLDEKDAEALQYEYEMSQLPEGVDPETGDWLPGYQDTIDAIDMMSHEEIDQMMKDEEKFFNSPELSDERIEQIKKIIDSGKSKKELAALLENLVSSDQLEQVESDQILGLYDKLTSKESLTLTGDETPIGITHEITDELRDRLHLSERNSETVTDEETDKLAREWIDNGGDVNGIITRMKNLVAPTAVETRVIKMYMGKLQERLEMNPTGELIAEAKRLTEATGLIGSEQGRSFRERKGMQFDEESLAAYILKKSEANKTDYLTQQQIEEAQKAYEAIKAQNDLLQKNIEEQAKRIAKLEAEKIIRNVSSKRSSNQKKHEDFVAERQRILDEMKKSVKEAKNMMMSTPIPLPYLPQILAALPHVAKIVKSYGEEGITELSKIVDDIHGVLSSDPDSKITKDDIIDMIAGKYNKETQKTKSEIRQNIRTITKQAEQIAALEKVEAKKPDTESGKQKQNQEKTKLRKALDTTKPIDELTKEKNKMLAQIKKLNTDLANENYKQDNTKKPIVELDAEGKILKDELIRLKIEWKKQILADSYKNRHWRTKWADNAISYANLSRSLMTVGDFSAVLRQGLFASIAHPTLAAKAFKEMMKQTFSQKEFDRWFVDLSESDDYGLMMESGLAIGDPHDWRLSVKEDNLIAANLAEKIPIYGPLIVKSSERAFMSYINKLRADLFMQGVERLSASGKTFENAEEDYKSLASMVNNLTGRGGLLQVGKIDLNKAAPVLNAVFFSAKLISSRLNLLGISDLSLAGNGFYGNLTPEVRKWAIMDMTKSLAFLGTVVGLIAYGFGCDGEDCISVETDPRSSDFMKIKLGNTRYDVWGGTQQYIRLLVELLYGESKNLKTGEIEDVSKWRSKGEIIQGFARRKLAPTTAIFVNYLSLDKKAKKDNEEIENYLDKIVGVDALGNQVTLEQALWKNTLPLISQDMYSVYKDLGWKALVGSTPLMMLGSGVNTYSEKEKKVKE